MMFNIYLVFLYYYYHTQHLTILILDYHNTTTSKGFKFGPGQFVEHVLSVKLKLSKYIDGCRGVVDNFPVMTYIQLI